MKKKVFVLTAVLWGSLLQAQEDTGSLSEVVVTASKIPQKQNTTGKVVTVIGQEVLSKSVGRTLPELLNQQAGITVIGSQNNLGTNQDVFLQGASSGKTLVLIDGVPAYDPSTIFNAFDLNHFSIDNIERIEIVRGAMSTLYGSDAVAGVINIITKKSGKKPVAIYSTVAGGTYDTRKGVIGVNGDYKRSRYHFQYSRLQSRGLSAAYDSTGTKGFDQDGFEQNVFSAKFSTDLAQNLLLKINGQTGKYNTDLDANAFTDDRDYFITSRNYQAGTGLEYRYNRGTLFFTYTLNNTRRDYFDDSTHVGGFAKFTTQKYTGRSHVAELYTNLRLNQKLDLLIGTDYRAQNTDQQFFSVSSFGPFTSERGSDSTKMDQYSIYTSAFLKNTGGFHLELGGRYNHHSSYGNNFTYSFTPSFLINGRLKLFANIGSAFKAPTLYQLFVVNTGNKQLEPETSRTIDGGIEYTDAEKGLRARAIYFTRKVKNGIEYSFVTFDYFNNNRQKDHGGEAEVGVNTELFSFAVNYTYVTGKVNTVNYRYDPPSFSYVATGDTTYNNLFRRPAHTVNASISFQPMENLLISTAARFAGKRLEPVFMGKPIELKSYQTVDVYTEYRINPKLKAFADLKNITNEQFFDIRGYNSRRFNFMAGINLNL